MVIMIHRAQDGIQQITGSTDLGRGITSTYEPCIVYVQRISPDFSAADAMRGITSANRERSIGAEWDGGVDLKEEEEEEEEVMVEEEGEEEKETAEGMEGEDNIDLLAEEEEVAVLCVGA
jgi:hypothetical protein